MSHLTISIGKESTESEIAELLKEFNGIDVLLDSGRIRLHEPVLPMLIEFSINAIVGGLLWDAVKTATQRIREKEGVSIKRTILQKLIYKNRTITITKDSIQIIGIKTIKVTSIDEAISKIDENT